MKANTFSARINVWIDNILGALDSPGQPASRAYPGKEPRRPTRVERNKRREFFYYKKLIDLDTNTVIGDMADISAGGFKLDCTVPIPINKDFRLSMNLASDIADKPHMTFIARSRWCGVDPLDPYVYNVGFQLLNIAPDDLEIFNRMLEKYSRDMSGRVVDMRRSNKW